MHTDMYKGDAVLYFCIPGALRAPQQLPSLTPNPTATSQL